MLLQLPTGKHQIPGFQIRVYGIRACLDWMKFKFEAELFGRRSIPSHLCNHAMRQNDFSGEVKMPRITASLMVAHNSAIIRGSCKLQYYSRLNKQALLCRSHLDLHKSIQSTYALNADLCSGIRVNDATQRIRRIVM